MLQWEWFIILLFGTAFFHSMNGDNDKTPWDSRDHHVNNLSPIAGEVMITYTLQIVYHWSNRYSWLDHMFPQSAPKLSLLPEGPHRGDYGDETLLEDEPTCSSRLYGHSRHISFFSHKASPHLVVVGMVSLQWTFCCTEFPSLLTSESSESRLRRVWGEMHISLTKLTPRWQTASDHHSRRMTTTKWHWRFSTACTLAGFSVARYLTTSSFQCVRRTVIGSSHTSLWVICGRWAIRWDARYHLPVSEKDKL